MLCDKYHGAKQQYVMTDTKKGTKTEKLRKNFIND